MASGCWSPVFLGNGGAPARTGVGFQFGQDAAGQAQAAGLRDHVHALDLGVAVGVALLVLLLRAPGAAGHGRARGVVGEEVEPVRGSEHRRVERGRVALALVALAVFELDLVVQLHRVGVVVGGGAQFDPVRHADIVRKGLRGGGKVPGCFSPLPP
jgi:hypothetical protein